MVKILLVESTYPLNSRNVRILNSIKKLLGNTADVRFLAWNRDDCEVMEQDRDMFIFNRSSPYGNNFKKLNNLRKFGGYIKEINRTFNPDYLIASHWECLLLCARIKAKSQHLVYENLDMPTFSYRPVLGILQMLERRSLRKTDAIIQSSRFFIEKYNFFEGKQILLENRPSIALSENKSPGKYSLSGKNTKVAFVGILRYFDVMKNLVRASNGLNIEILFWGDGPDEEKLKSYCSGMGNVHFYGRYNYHDIPAIYEDVDLIWAVYPAADYNVKFAISNKFFESMIMNKPSVFAKETLLGDMVQEKKIGFAVDPYSISEIRKLLKDISVNKQVLNETKKNIAEAGEKIYWEEEENKLKSLFTN